MGFDAVKFLEEYDIAHRTQGKGTTSGWVQIQECPFCFNDNYHLGINLHKDYFHCWVCNKSGRPEFLIYRLLRIAYRNAKEIAEKYGSVSYFETEPGQRAESVVIKGLSGLAQIHINYLKSRGYDPYFLERKYRIDGCYTVGRFPYRVVIPIYDDGVLVNATARDVTNQQEEKYLSLSNEEAVLPRKECVYNIDSVTSENILVVEGPFDVYRIGGATVSTLGTAFTHAQVMRILSKIPKNVYIMFDKETEAQNQANKLASCLGPFVDHVEVMEIPVKDPAMLTTEQALEIRSELKL